MSLVNGVWHDTSIKNSFLNNKIYGEHIYGLEPNSDGINIVKCIKCHIARMFLQGHDQPTCQGVGQ